MIMWEFANQAFGAFVGQEPLKKGVPLSERANVYANPTLLAGLKSKKEIIKVSQTRISPVVASLTYTI